MEVKTLFIRTALLVLLPIGVLSVYFIPAISHRYAEIRDGIAMTDAKMATALDDTFMPVQPTNIFPNGTKEVFCWFAWANAVPATEIKAEWHYATDDIHIFSSNVNIPRHNGSGGVSLKMPEGKPLPIGAYRVDLTAKDRVLKSLTFKVE